MRETAAVVADIEDDAVLVEVVRVKSADETVQTLLVHAANVNIAETAFAEFGDALGVLPCPIFVHQFANLGPRFALNLQPPFALQVGGICGHLQDEGIADLVVEQRRDLQSGR